MFTVVFSFIEAYKEAFDAWRDKVSALIFTSVMQIDT